ncbi:hypothetical protein Trydic_g22553 [Trypoxylus dichotomus]
MNNYEVLSERENRRTNIDLIKRLEQRCGGYVLNTSSSLYDLEVHAEDIFVKKKFDELRCEMPGTPRSTFLMVFSPDGSKVASTHGNHNIYVTDVRSGKNIKTLVGHPRTPWCIAFHPTSNQILASGCLGGQVRIWDLSGGSETWTSEIPTVIASIAFHPDDRLLVIATYNELYFWDWSKPEPFMHVATGSIKEKVRYVAFDKLGHKLITGISNSPQTRWERVRTAVPVPRQADRSASPYRRRITPRLISNTPTVPNSSENAQSTGTNTTREPLTTVPERERRITACYRNLVREYELLVHRYLQIYRPPTMIDQGTDPMEVELNSVVGSSTSSESANASNSQSRTSSNESMENIFPASSYHSFSSLVNDINRISCTSANPLSGRSLFDTASRMNTSQRQPLNRLSSSVDDSDSTTFGNPPNTTELTTCSETLEQHANVTTLQNDTRNIHNQRQILDPTLSNLENNTLVLNSQEVRLSPNNVHSIPSGSSIKLIKNISNQNRERNSAPNLPHCSYMNNDVNVLQHNDDLQLPVNTDPLSDSVTHHEPLQNINSSMLLNSIASNANTSQIKNENVNPKAVYLATSNSENSSLNGQPTSKFKDQCTNSLGNSTNLSDGVACEVSRETKHVLHNINSVSDALRQTNFQNREPCVRYIKSNVHNLTNSVEPRVLSKETCSRNPNTLQNSNVSPFDVEPRPSTSGSCVTSLESYDNSNAAVNSKFHPSKQNKTRFYEQSRKRDYPPILKKNRRPFIDSSSDSSSEEEELASKRLRTAKPSSFPCRTPSTNTNSYRTSDVISNSGQRTGNNNTTPTERTVNFNRELDVLVTDLLMNNEQTQNTSNVVSSNRTALKPNVEESVRQSRRENLTTLSTDNEQCNNVTPTARSNCLSSTENSDTRMANSTIFAHAGNPRPNRSGRFFSHRVSAFYPTRIQNLRPFSRLRRHSDYLSPSVRNRLRILNALENSSRLGGTFALDEVINYSERVATEDISEPDIGFHPFDPPPEVAAINPENIGIGNMYSNIVQELESSLNDVRNIRASSRLGETSDMLSSFSERLESIMNQSNAILRNLRTSIDVLQPNHQSVTTSSSNIDCIQSSSSRTNQPRMIFTDSSFYLREQANNQTGDERLGRVSTNILDRSTSQDELYSNHNSNNSVAFDHTYPLNSRNSDSTSNMSPLMVSLHLTVSHIQRQARLLRQQVESIERIDRAMLEVAQLQMMRQMFIEMQCYFRAVQCNENRSSLSRVRQMMAGTRISDSSPYDSPNDDSGENPSVRREERTHNNDTSTNLPQSSTVTRAHTRKTYPRCMFLMQRYLRRGSFGNIFQRRCLSRDRVTRRHSSRRSYTYRPLAPRMPVDLNRHLGNVNQLSSDTLRSITRRLESFLMEHGRHIGRVLEHVRNNTSTDKVEYIMMLRLNQCRNRILGQDFYSNSNIRRQTNSVTADGSARYNARDILTTAIENLSRHVMNGTNITPSLRASIWNVIDLSLLLSEILLLQIVDSIPPPSGMNLDSERESLSARIDQMCSRMLQNRLSGQSQQLTRSLRLTRLAVRHASRALNQTYTARRNSMVPTTHNRDQRRTLLEEINNCLRNIRRHGVATQMSNQRAGLNIENLSRTEWYRTIHSLITRYRCSNLLENSQTSTNNNYNNTNTDNAAQTEGLQTLGSNRYYSLASSDDDNESWYNNNQTNHNTSDERNDHLRPLYRTNNVNLFNLLNTEEQSSSGSSRNRSWNVPIVQINDIPVSQYELQRHPRLLAGRQRGPERLSELRTYPVGSFYRPRFLHPLHASNPFEADFDDSVREQIYDSDIMAPITPNHRIQVWEFSSGLIPNINNALKNVVVNECKIHNDASVDIANNGNILVTLLPSGGYLNGTNRLGVYSLKWETLGQCLYITNFEQNAVSVSLSPLSRHLVVGLASRRVSVIPNEKWTMARIFVLDNMSGTSNQLSPIREVEQTRDPNYMSVNCIRWLPVSGQGLVYATNTGQLRILT